MKQQQKPFLTLPFLRLARVFLLLWKMSILHKNGRSFWEFQRNVVYLQTNTNDEHKKQETDYGQDAACSVRADVVAHVATHSP